MARIAAVLYCLIPIWGAVNPRSLKLWNHRVELDLRSFHARVGETIRITCDGSSVGLRNPYLGWYGPDKFLISHRGKSNRIHTENLKPLKNRGYSRYQKLVIRSVRTWDAGIYTCLGWFGQEVGYKKRTIELIVVGAAIHPMSTSTRTNMETNTLATEYPTVGQVHPDSDESCFFSCNNGKCLDKVKVCDQFPNCEGGEDESNCPGISCNEDQVVCKDHSNCIPKSLVCDGDEQCGDGSDEIGCAN